MRVAGSGPARAPYTRARDSLAARRCAGRLRPVHHHRADHGEPCRAAHHLAGDALLPPGRSVHRRHHGSRLSQEGERCPGQPARRAAVLRCHRQRPERRSDRACPGICRRSTTPISTPTASATPRESVEKLPALGKLQPPDAMKRFFNWYYTRIYIHVRPERIYVWRSPSIRARALRRAHGGGPLRPLRGTRALPRRSRGRHDHVAPPAGRARHPPPDRRPLDRLSRRLPVCHARARALG